MKLLILILTTFSLTQAFAGEFKTYKNQKMTGKQLAEVLKRFAPSQRSGADPRSVVEDTPVVTPVRQAKFKVEFYKISVTKTGEGFYSFSSQQVCIREGVTNVYDLRGIGSAQWSNGPMVDCPTTLNGQPATVKAFSDLLLNRRRLFSDEPESDMKVALFGLYVDVNSRINQTEYTWVNTRDINSSSIMATGGSAPSQVCTPVNDGSGDVQCDIVEGEYFSGEYEALD